MVATPRCTRGKYTVTPDVSGRMSEIKLPPHRIAFWGTRSSAVAELYFRAGVPSLACGSGFDTYALVDCTWFCSSAGGLDNISLPQSNTNSRKWETLLPWIMTIYALWPTTILTPCSLFVWIALLACVFIFNMLNIYFWGNSLKKKSLLKTPFWVLAAYIHEFKETQKCIHK